METERENILSFNWSFELLIIITVTIENTVRITPGTATRGWRGGWGEEVGSSWQVITVHPALGSFGEGRGGHFPQDFRRVTQLPKDNALLHAETTSIKSE